MNTRDLLLLPILLLSAFAGVSNEDLLRDHFKLTELMYHSHGGGDFDFVEFQNTSSTETLDASGVAITNGVNFAFPAGTLMPPASFILVAKTPGAPFDAWYGLTGTTTVLGPYTGNLSNGGERIRVELASGSEIIDFTYNDNRQWPCGADGGGHSLIPKELADQRGPLDDSFNWGRSRFRRGSPGQADPSPRLIDALINEFVSNSTNDWIELYNLGFGPANLTDYYLSNNEDQLDLFGLPPSALNRGEWVSYDLTTGFGVSPTTGFDIDQEGGKIFLSHLPANGPGEVIDCICHDGQKAGESTGRFTDGLTAVVNQPPSRDTANLPPIYSVIISEIMYHPPDLSGSDNTRDEYIEIYNPTTTPVPLFNSTGPWRLRGSADFEFPFGIVLQPGETALILTIDPGDVADVTAFANAYGTTLPSTVLGPALPDLNNGAGRVSLQEPLAPVDPTNAVSWIIRDEVIYGDSDPWPSSPDANGDALTRIFANQPANNVSNWEAKAPTPGIAATPVDPSLEPIPLVTGISVTSLPTHEAQLTSAAIPGRRYALDISSLLLTPTWQEVAQKNASSTVLSWQDVSPVTSGDLRYYRVRLLP